MKKRLLIVSFILIILFSIFVQAAENLASNINNKLDSSDIKKQTDDTINQRVQLPNFLKGFARIFFQTNEDLRISRFIILSIIFVVIFLLIVDILKIMPFFKGYLVWPAGAAITSLIGLGGGIKAISDFFLGTTSFFTFLEEWEVGKVIFFFIIITIIFFILNKVISVIQQKTELEAAKKTGVEAGTGLGILKIIARAFKRANRK